MQADGLYDAVRSADAKTWLMAAGVVASVVTAKLLARRQELGKRQHQDLLEIRDVVYEALHQVRAAVSYAASSGELQAKELEERLRDFAATICTNARSLPVRRRRRIRRLLVVLVGESGMQMAEEMGTAYLQTEPDWLLSTGSTMATTGPASARDGWCDGFRKRPGAIVTCGLLCLHDDDPQDLALDRLHQALPVLERLLNQAGAQTRLAPRTLREVTPVLAARVRRRSAAPRSAAAASADPHPG